MTLKDINNTHVPGTTVLSQDGKTLTLNKASNLTPSTTYIATITGVEDLAGNTISPKTWKFTTRVYIVDIDDEYKSALTRARSEVTDEEIEAFPINTLARL